MIRSAPNALWAKAMQSVTKYRYAPCLAKRLICSSIVIMHASVRLPDSVFLINSPSRTYFSTSSMAVEEIIHRSQLIAPAFGVLEFEICGDDVHVLDAAEGLALVFFGGLEGFGVQGCAGGCGN